MENSVSLVDFSMRNQLPRRLWAFDEQASKDDGRDGPNPNSSSPTLVMDLGKACTNCARNQLAQIDTSVIAYGIKYRQYLYQHVRGSRLNTTVFCRRQLSDIKGNNHSSRTHAQADDEPADCELLDTERCGLQDGANDEDKASCPNRHFPTSCQ